LHIAEEEVIMKDLGDADVQVEKEEHRNRQVELSGLLE